MKKAGPSLRSGRQALALLALSGATLDECRVAAVV
jgi:hypothetical protein